FLLVVASISIAVYLLFILNLVPGAKEQRLGVLEDLPADLGHWKAEEETADGRIREVRHILHEGSGLFSPGKLIHQVRYRDKASGEIVRVEPEEVVKRKRIKRSL
ncbi:MAG TPA: hypothetical protein VM686_42740, partial [Polyangiaceae bacterium]|nr:hypothetical protein [Polyangiaceae bacterium]